MQLQPIDWIIIIASLAICFVPALFYGKRAGKSTSEFFVSGRAVPWWLAGLSMVATTFSSDTPNLVTDIVRRNGVEMARFADQDAAFDEVARLLQDADRYPGPVSLGLQFQPRAL